MNPTTPEEIDAFHAERRTRMGASDVPIAAGMSDYMTPHELWLEKTGRVEPWSGNTLTEYGHDFEPVVVTRAERLWGAVERDVRVWRTDLDFPLAATLDARIIATGEPINAKTSGLGGFINFEWGEEYSDGVPDHYFAQSIVEQFCAQASAGYLYAMLNGRRGIEFRPYVVQYDEAIAATLIEAARRFWIDHVEADVEPPWTEKPAAMDTLSRRIREAGKIQVISRDDEQAHDNARQLFRDYVEARETRLEAEKREDLLKRTLIHHFGDGDQLTIDGVGVATYFEQTTSRKATAATSYKFRVLRIKQNLLQPKAPKS